MDFMKLLKRIMDSDPNIRHSIICNNEGKILATHHRPGVTNYLSQKETAEALKRAAISWKGRNELVPKIGRGLYAIAAFEKITRMTFPVGEDNLIFVSLGTNQIRTEIHGGGEKQIVEHILNILSRDPTLT
jgi:hypothetical protein